MLKNPFKYLENAINPESYNGTDAQRLQAAFDDAAIKDKAVCISKTYNIGSNTIMINKPGPLRKPLYIFGGGKVYKDTPGFMFKASYMSTSDIYINQVAFEGVDGVDIFDCSDGKLIRINTNMCHFKSFRNLFYSNTYVQDIKMNQDTVIKCSGAIFDVGGIFVASIRALTMEESSGQVIAKRLEGGLNYFYNVTVEDSVIEGFVNCTKPIFDIMSGKLTLNNNYFEIVPAGLVRFEHFGEIHADNNNLLGNTNGIPFVTFGTTLTKSVSELTNNICTLSPLIDATKLTSIGKVLVSNNTSNYDNIDPNGRIYDVSKNLVSNKIHKIESNYTAVTINKNIPNTTKVDLLNIELSATTGGYIAVRGGGIQGNLGSFGINKIFKVTRTNSVLTVLTDVTDSWGDSPNQKDNIFLEISGTSFILKANSRTDLAAVVYDIVVEIYAKTNKVTII